VAEQEEVEENEKEKESKSNHRLKYRKGDPKSEKFLPPAKVADDCNKADNLISRINKFKGLQKMKIVKIRKNTEVSKTLPHIKPPPYLPSNPPQLVGFNVRFDVYLMTLHRAGLHVYLIDTSGQKPSPVSFPFHRPLVIQSPKLFTVLVKL